MNLKIQNFLKKYYPFLILLGVVLIIFRKFIFGGLLPIPSDIITGVYYPWLNQKWGTITGVPVKNPLPSDIPSLLYPWRLQSRNQIFSGNFPLWNDQIFSGMPLFANFQSSVLSLGTLLFLFIKNDGLSWSLGVFFQPLFMAISAYVFFREIKFSKITSSFGSLLFSLNGFSIVWLEYNVHGWVLGWLPLILYAGELICKKNRWGGVLLTVSVAGSIFSGYPQLTLYSFLTVLIYFLIKLFLRKIDIKNIFIIGLFSILGLGLSSILLLPGFESANLSIRSVDTVATSFSTRFLPVTYVTNLFAPDIHGNPATGNYSGIGFFDNFAIYIGISSFIISIIGLLSKEGSRSLRLFSVILVISGLLLSTQNPIGVLVANLNIFGIKSIAARAMLMTILGFIILTMIGVDSISKKIRVIDIVFSTLTLFCVLILFTLSNDTVYRHNLYLPIAFGVATTVGLLVGKLISKTMKLIPLFLLLILIFELSRFAEKYLSFTPSTYLFPETPIISEIIKSYDINNSKYEFGEVIPENMWVPYGIKSAAGYDATAPLAYSRLLGMVGGKNLDHPQGRVGKIDQINKVSDLIGVNYLFTFSKKDGKPDSLGKTANEIIPPKYSEVLSEGPVKVFRINGSSKMIDFYSKSFSYKNQEEFVNIVNSSEYDPSNQILVKNGETKNINDINNLSIISENPGDITVKVTSKVGGYVGLKQNYYPGWTASVDGNKTELLEADYAFMAAKVNPGEHTVNFKYLPNSFVLGSLLSGVSFIILIIYAGRKVKY